MAGLDLSAAIEAESEETTTTTKTEDSKSLPFQPNEGSDGYALFANSAALVEAISTEVLGNEPMYDAFEPEWDATLEDYTDLIEGVEATKMQKLSLLHKLAKGSFGAIQRENPFGMGWDTDEKPPKPYDPKEVDWEPYLGHFGDLEAFDHYTLEGGEVADLESNGIDFDNFGFNRSMVSPQLPKINGERVPILFEGNDEVTTFLKMMNSIDFEEVTRCDEDGNLIGTPTLGGETTADNSEKGGGRSSKAKKTEDEVNLAENPKGVIEMNAEAIKKAVTPIESKRTLETMIRIEKENEDRSSVLERINQKIRAVEGSNGSNDEEDVDEADAEGGEADEGDADGEAVEAVEMTDGDKNLISALLNSGEAESFEEAKGMVLG